MQENMLRNNDLDNPSDNKIASYLATKSKKMHKELKLEYLKHPELIQAKKTQFLINRKIKKHGQK
ncbi:hypothetical protein FHT21_000744 [Pedobacter sp. SG908]|nr:hypothetical protein [Pedobacter sp. SG908]NMN35703.1 hypothetical protein [Pedobacter sp. SG918]